MDDSNSKWQIGARVRSVAHDAKGWTGSVVQRNVGGPPSVGVLMDEEHDRLQIPMYFQDYELVAE